MKRVTEYREETETIVHRVPIGTKTEFEPYDLLYCNNPASQWYRKFYYISSVLEKTYEVTSLPDFSHTFVSKGYEDENLREGSIIHLGKFTKA